MQIANDQGALELELSLRTSNFNSLLEGRGLDWRKKPRRTFTPEQRLAMVHDCAQPGVSVAHDGGERAAAMYSLLETAKLNGIDPEAYLRQVLQRISDLPINRIAELLPWNLAPAAPHHEMPLAA